MPVLHQTALGCRCFQSLPPPFPTPVQLRRVRSTYLTTATIASRLRALRVGFVPLLRARGGVAECWTGLGLV